MAGLDTVKMILLWVNTALIVACVVVGIIFFIEAKSIKSDTEDILARIAEVERAKAAQAGQDAGK